LPASSFTEYKVYVPTKLASFSCTWVDAN
jgi:hypothetical protein